MVENIIIAIIITVIIVVVIVIIIINIIVVVVFVVVVVTNNTNEQLKQCLANWNILDLKPVTVTPLVPWVCSVTIEQGSAGARQAP